MKVLLLTSSYAPVLGGLQTVTEALARNLLARGHEVRVVTNRYPRSLPAKEMRQDVAVERWQFLRPSREQLRRGRLDLFLASLYYAPTVRARLRRLLISFRPDVVNVHFPDAQTRFLLGLKRRFGFRLVVSLHGHDVERFTANDGHTLDVRPLQALLREADAVTACSRHLLKSAGRLEPSARAKGVVLYNGISPERFQDATPYVHPRPYIFAMGRLTRKKGFDLLLHALTRVNPSAGDADLILAGEGEERKTLESQARQLGLGGRVHFYGRASQEEVVRLLNGCALLVIPSREEPFGIVAVEGLAAGKPVLATRVGGMAEFLTQAFVPTPEGPGGGNGLGGARVKLVEPNAAALTEGIEAQLASTSERSEGEEARGRVRDEYSWHRVAERYECVLGGRTEGCGRVGG